MCISHITLWQPKLISLSIIHLLFTIILIITDHSWVSSASCHGISTFKILLFSLIRGKKKKHFLSSNIMAVKHNKIFMNLKNCLPIAFFNEHFLNVYKTSYYIRITHYAFHFIEKEMKASCVISAYLYHAVGTWETPGTSPIKLFNCYYIVIYQCRNNIEKCACFKPL